MGFSRENMGKTNLDMRRSLIFILTLHVKTMYTGKNEIEQSKIH